MKKIIPSFIILFLLLSSQNFIHSQLRSVNFQGAGWVTAVKYSADASRLYARTDVGGVFKSDNGGQTWSFISGYALTLSSLYVQGLIIHPSNNNIVYAACGVSYRPNDPGKGVWKTVDGGNTWTQALSTVNYSGNDNIRWGGECLAFDPANPEIIYTGGRESGIYKSINGGASWNLIAAPNVVSGNISSITIRPGTSGNTAEIWVGSEGNAGVWRSQNGGANWTQMRTSAQVENVVFRIAVKTDGSAFVAYNQSLVKYSGGIWSSIGGFSGEGSLAAVHFMGSENRVIASRMNYTKLSNDGGATFGTVLPMTLTGPLPKHSYNWTVVDWARNCFQQNPVNANEWYISGGFGCIKSGNAGLTWQYATDGINIPVMYRTHFHLTDPNYVFLPMGDLTMGRLTDGGATGEVADYAFYSFNILQDFSNASAVLTTAANPNRQYLAGGNIYAQETPGVFITNNNGANYTRQTGTGLPNTTNRPLINGVASNSNADQLIVFVGGDYSNIGTTGGIYWSTNAGQNFTRAGGLPQNIIAPNVFYSHYGLGKDITNNSKRYGYFEGDGGGFFESSDEGKNWSLKSSVIGAGYKPAGTLCVHPSTADLFYLAVSESGLYKTTDGGTAWNSMSGWESGEQVDARGNIITVFGKRTGDTYDKIYKSTNSGASWELIVTDQYKLPNTTSLVINPHNNNQLWIGTTGNGTFIFTGLTIGITNLSTEIPDVYELLQNYPNPFNPVTNINFSLPQNGLTKLIVYDMLGEEIAVLVNSDLKGGTYKVDWDASNMPSGVYLCKLSSGKFSEVKKMILVK
jgi:photosystem II stability/assembly factor-like uncharacterized protein